VINTPYTVTVPASGPDAAAGSLSLTGNGSVAVGASRSLAIKNEVTAAAGSSITLGSSSSLSVGQTSSIASLLTGGDSTIRNLNALTLSGFNDQGIAGVMRLYGPSPVTIAGAKVNSVAAKSTNFLVNSGATLNAGGRVLLGGDPQVTLNGGTFTVTPDSSNPAYTNAYMGATNVAVSASSTVKANTAGTVGLGYVQLSNPCTLTASGPGTLNFVGTELKAAGTSGISIASGDIAVTSLAPGAGTTVGLSAQGSHRLVLAGAVNAPAADLTVSRARSGPPAR